MTLQAQETIAPHGEDHLLSVVEDIRQLVPFRHIIISGLNVNGMGAGTGTLLYSDFPSEYVAEYYAGSFVSKDPLAEMFYRGNAPVYRDSEAFATPEARRAGHEVLDLLRRHGIPERTFIRVFYGGVLAGTVTLISDRPLSDHHCQLLQTIAMSLHSAAARPAMELLNRHLRLSAGEVYCLQRAAQGLTSEAIADEGIYSLDTVNTYFKTAARKIGASNRTQAVADAMRRGLIG